MISVIIPTLNEKKNILTAIFSKKIDKDINPCKKCFCKLYALRVVITKTDSYCFICIILLIVIYSTGSPQRLLSALDDRWSLGLIRRKLHQCSIASA